MWLPLLLGQQSSKAPLSSALVSKPSAAEHLSEVDLKKWHDRLCADPIPNAIFDEEGAHGVDTTFYVAATRERLMNVLWDARDFPRIFPDLKKVTFEEEKESDSTIRVELSVLKMNFTYTTRRFRDKKTGEIKWYETGGDFRKVRGLWRIRATETPGISAVTYRSFLDVGYFIPTRLARTLAMKKLDELAENVRKASEPPKVRKLCPKR